MSDFLYVVYERVIMPLATMVVLGWLLLIVGWLANAAWDAIKGVLK